MSKSQTNVFLMKVLENGWIQLKTILTYFAPRRLNYNLYYFIIMNYIKNLLRYFPFIKWFIDVRREITHIKYQVTLQTRIQQHLYRQNLSKKNIQEGRAFPAAYEHQTFSQNGEDGILLEILKRINTNKGYFCEIGSGDGKENNTRILLESGWKGIWLDGNNDSCLTASKANEKFVKIGNLKISNVFLTADNINLLLSEALIPKVIDVLSLDLDLNTYHIWEKLEETKPKVAIIEYNGFYPVDSDWVATYEKNGCWDGGINMGTSLKPLVSLSEKKGYSLIGCDLSGTNAFFVRKDLAKSHFTNLPNYEELFESAKPFLHNNPEHRID